MVLYSFIICGYKIQGKLRLVETEAWVSLNSKIWIKCISVIHLCPLMENYVDGLPLPSRTTRAGFLLLGKALEPMWPLKPRWGQPSLTWVGKEGKAWFWEQLQHRGDRWGRTGQQWESSAFGGGGFLSSCWDEKEGADLWLAVERHRAALAGRSRTGEVVPQWWSTACRAKEMANIWVKQLKVKNKCTLSHASAISFSADHVAVIPACLHR